MSCRIAICACFTAVFGACSSGAGSASAPKPNPNTGGGSDGSPSSFPDGGSSSSGPVGSAVDGSAGPTDQSFTARCAGAGVVLCEGFDSAAKFAPANYPNAGVYPADDGVQRVTFDSTTKASGAGSAKFAIDANSPTGAQVSGYWMQPIGKSFGANSTFYVQYRFRMDTAMATTNWEDVAMGGSSPKISIFHNAQATCASEELTTNNREGTSMAMMYTDCGSRGLFVAPGTTNWSDSVPPYEFQNGYYFCEYPAVPHSPGGCFTMPANDWMTFYFRVSLGDWGQPNSTIIMWVAADGQPLQKLVDVENMAMNQDGTNEYDTVTLLNYMTDFGQMQTPTNPAATSWYDDLIVSTAPIAAPTGPTPE